MANESDYTIDELVIEVNSEKVEDDSLNRLQEVLNKLQAIGNTVASYGKNGVDNLKSIMDAISNIGDVGANIDTLIQRLENLGKTDISLGNADVDSQLGGIGEQFDEAEQEIKKVASSVEEAAQETSTAIGGMSSAFSDGADNVKNATDQMEQATEKTKRKISDFSSYNARAVAKGMTAIDSRVAMTADTMKTRIAVAVEEAKQSLAKFGDTKAGKSEMGQTNIANALEKITELADATYSEFASKVESKSNDVKASLEDMANSSSRNMDTIRSSTAETMTEITNMSRLDFAKFLTQLDALMRSAKGVGSQSKDVKAGSVNFDKLGKAAKAAGSAVADMAKKGFSKIKKSVSDTIAPLQRLLKTFKRLLLVRVLRNLLTQLQNAMKEGINNAYQYSKAFGVQLADSLDRISASALYAKNSFGAMAAPIINAVAPAIEFLTDKVVALANALNQLFAMLGGQSTWTRAIKTQKEYAEAVGGGSSALKDYLLSIDELNVLNDNGSGGGGGAAMDYTKMFEEVSTFDAWLDELKKAVEEGDWYGVGEIIANKLNEAISDVPAEEWGTSIGTKLDNAFTAALGFLENIDTETLGEKGATLINAIFSEWNTETVGRVLAEKTNAFNRAISGFVTELDWETGASKIQEGINGWIDQIDLNSFATNFDTTWQGLMTTLQGIAGSDWYTLGAKAGDALNHVDWSKDINDGIRAVKKMAEAIGKFIAGTLVYIKWEDFTSGIAEGVLKALTEVFTFGIETGTDLAVIIGDALQRIMLHAIAYALDVVGAHSWANELREISDTMTDDFAKPFVEKGPQIRDDFFEKVSEIEDFDINAPTIQTELFDKSLEELADNANTTLDTVNTNVTATTESIAKTVNIKTEGITKKTKQNVDPISKITVFEDWKKNDPDKVLVESTFKTASDKVAKAAEAGLKYVKGIKVFSDYYRDNVKPYFKESDYKTLGQNAVKGLKTGLDLSNYNPVSGVVSNISTSLNYNTMYSYGSSAMSGIAAGLRSVSLPEIVIESKTQYTHGSSVSIPSFKLRANGGFPDEGEMFIAREAGPEMVGSIGNKSAVANNDQIVDAVALGVYEAMVSAMNTANSNNDGGETRIIVQLDGNKLYDGMQKVGRNRGYSLGMGAFGYGTN